MYIFVTPRYIALHKCYNVTVTVRKRLFYGISVFAFWHIWSIFFLLRDPGTVPFLYAVSVSDPYSFVTRCYIVTVQRHICVSAARLASCCDT